MSETKAVFAERTIRSLKNLLYRYMRNLDTNIYTNYLSSLLPKTLDQTVR